MKIGLITPTAEMDDDEPSSFIENEAHGKGVH